MGRDWRVKNNKRVLLISHNALSLHSNNGKTINSMFSGWNRSEVAQLYFQDEIPESKQFRKFFRVRDLDIIKTLFLLRKQAHCGNTVLPKEKVESHYESFSKSKLLIIRLLRKTEVLKLILRDVVYGTGIWRSADLIAWITDFSPDSIFFVGGNSTFSFNIASKLSSIFEIPLDIYITDDYILNAQPQGFLAKVMQSNPLPIR